MHTAKFLILVLVLTTIAWGQQPVTAAQKDTITQQYLRLPLAFEANRGQTGDMAKFLAHASGYGMMFEPGGIAFVIPGEKQPQTVRLSWIGAQTQNILGEQPLTGRINYLHGNDPKAWVTDVPIFARLRYRQLYPGVDLVYYGTNRQLEYDLVVTPGSDPSRISFRVQGARVQISNGELVIKTSSGELRQHTPVIYQDVAGKRRTISGKYVMLAADRVGFQLGKHDPTLSVVIDPKLSYSTYLGGAGTELGTSIAVDSSGRAYVTGLTSSGATFPRKDAEQQTFGGAGDAFVTKFWATGGGLIYSTFLGGGDSDIGTGIAVDRFANAYVVGRTRSTDFPTTVGAFQESNHGSFDNFVTKLSPSGSSLVYSTYLGGSGDDSPQGMTVDPSGRVYVTGSTDSTDFPTHNAIQPTPKSQVNAYVTRLTGTGGALDYSTYLGGSVSQNGAGIVADSNDNAYVAGTTLSTDFPTTPGAYETSFGGPNCHTTNPNNIFIAFVTKFSPSGTHLVYSTYLGGCSGGAQAIGIAVDSSGRAYVTGNAGPDFPTTSGAYRRTAAFAANNGVHSGFVTRFAASGSSLSYSTFLGSAVIPHSIAVDVNTRAWVVGVNEGSDFRQQNSLQSCNGAGELQDAFAMKLWATGGGVFFATCLGGPSGDEASSVRLDGSGNGYITGFTNSSNFPTTAGAFDRTYGGAADAFVVKIIP
jgi:hypothetical protein